MTMGRLGRTVTALLVGSLLSGCALLTPLPRKSAVEQRLAAFPTQNLPLEGTVTIRWDAHQIPFIEAEHDGDAAFALGLVHAHLRLGQMALVKRIARGRISEMGGPLANDIDHGLRLLDFGRAAPAIVQAMPPETRAWVDRFVAGINHYQATAKTLPVEYSILGLEREPWTAEDIVTFGRLAGTDVNWLVWFNVLQLRDREDWPEIWASLVNNGGDSTPSFAADGKVAALSDLLAGVSRSGSNSLAIAPSRSTTGGALLANDPHLGLNLPNLWIIAGVKSPSYHAVGLMVPSLPFFAIGRNPDIAWGGTNMRAASSDLFDVSDLPRGAIRERTVAIGTRWWFDRTVTLRDTEIGPVLSDAPQLAEAAAPAFALKWTGHQVSDEIGAMLAVSRASSFAEFREAFRPFAVSGQSMLYADRGGSIGMVLATRLPARSNVRPDDVILAPAQGLAAWEDMRGSDVLPFSIDPPSGFLASANNRPTAADIPLGWFFSPNDRMNRMTEIVEGQGRLGVDDLKALQLDVYMESAVALRDLLVAKMRSLGVAAAASGNERLVFDLMAGWDGHYAVDARGPVAYELFRHAFTESYYQSIFGAADWAAYASFSRAKSQLREDIADTDDRTLTRLLRNSLAEAAKDIDAFANWGDMHRLELRHPLAFLPVIGGRFRFGDHPAAGSSDTLMKTAHGATNERHRVNYGSQARHISDLSDPDANWFVLLGGQDGWFNSSTFVDQLPLWLEGDYIRMPLRPETVRATFPYVITLGR
jgi:penicillin G amidase